MKRHTVILKEYVEAGWLVRIVAERKRNGWLIQSMVNGRGMWVPGAVKQLLPFPKKKKVKA